MPGKSTFLSRELLENCKKSLKTTGKTGRVAIKLQAIISAGRYSISEVSKVYGISRPTLTSWIKSFLNNKEAGLKIKIGRGRKKIIDQSKEQEIKQKIAIDPNITMKKIKIYIKKKYKIEVSISTIYRIVKRLGFSHITARPLHYKTEIKEQEKFKKNLKK